MPEASFHALSRTIPLMALSAWLAACAATPAVDQLAFTETEVAMTSAAQGADVFAPSAGGAQKKPRLSVTGSDDLWARVRDGFMLPTDAHPRINVNIRWYIEHPEYLDRVGERAEPYLHFIVEELEARGFPREIALLPIVESAYQPFAYSHGRAAGIWQFIPGTGRRYGLKQNWWYDGRRDIVASTRAALDYLERLNKIFDGDWLLALAAYNSGEGTVNAAVRHNKHAGKPVDFWSLRLPPETQDYVPKLLALAMIVDNPSAYNITLRPIADTPYFTPVDPGGQIDLALAAELAGISIDEIYRLNPGFNRWATDPDGPHELIVPVDKAEDFAQALAELPPEHRIRWIRHTVRRGETLSEIAQEYRTTVDLLSRINNSDSHIVRAGANLIIPIASRDLDEYTLSAEQRLLNTQQRVRGETQVTLTVQPGDTLWDLARKYGVSPDALARWNGIAPRDVIRPGQRLVVWLSGDAALVPAVATAPVQKQRLNYTVRAGDSLSRISQRFNVTVSDLRKWNNLDSQKYLHPGQVLTLYIDVTEQSST